MSIDGNRGRGRLPVSEWNAVAGWPENSEARRAQARQISAVLWLIELLVMDPNQPDVSSQDNGDTRAIQSRRLRYQKVRSAALAKSRPSAVGTCGPKGVSQAVAPIRRSTALLSLVAPADWLAVGGVPSESFQPIEPRMSATVALRSSPPSPATATRESSE